MSKKDRADLPAFEHLSPGSSGRGRHSPLFRYLYDHADAFKRVLEEIRPSWGAITDALAKEGLTNGVGQPLSRSRVQKAWYAVEQTKARTKPEQRPPDPAPVVIQQPVRMRLTEDAEVPVPARTFGTALPRNHVPSPALQAATKPQPDPDPDRASRVIEVLTSGASRNRFKTDDGD